MRYANRTRRAWYCCDWANSVFSTSVTAVFLGPDLTGLARAAADPAGFVHPLGVALRAESVFPFATGLAMALLLLALPATAVVTRHCRRDLLLGALALLGAGATMALAAVEGTAYLAAALLFVVATVALAATVVVVDTYLPELAAPGDRGRVSATASAAGFASGSIVLVASGGLILALGTPTAIRLCLLLAGVWWLAFTVWPVLVLPGTPAGDRTAHGSRPGLRAAARALWRAPLVAAFLLAFLLYNNGLQGISSQSSTFAAEELRIDETGLIAAVLLVNVAGTVGALAAGRIAERAGAERALLASVALLATAAVLAAGAPAGSLPVFLAVAGLIGAGIGGVYPLSRAVFADLAPPGAPGASFAVFELVNRGFSALGLVGFGLVLQVGAGYRAAVLSVAAFLVLGGVLLLRVRTPAGATS